jgi:prophage antirepressor-like protein
MSKKKSNVINLRTIPLPEKNKTSKAMKDMNDIFELDENINNEVNKTNIGDNIIMKTFDYGNQSILMIKDSNGVVWAKGRDVALVLEYKNTVDAIEKHVHQEDKKTYSAITSVFRAGSKNLKPHVIFINQTGLFDLISTSRMPEAREFRQWLANDVIPSIYKNGSYSIPVTESEEEILKQNFYNKELLSSFINKNVIYLAYVGTYNKELIFKFGESSRFHERDLDEHRQDFDRFNVVYIKETYAPKIAEKKLKIDFESRNLTRKIKINNKTQTELIALNAMCNLEWCKSVMDHAADTCKSQKEIDLENQLIKQIRINKSLKNKLTESKIISKQLMDQMQDHINTLKYKIMKS